MCKSKIKNKTSLNFSIVIILAIFVVFAFFFTQSYSVDRTYTKCIENKSIAYCSEQGVEVEHYDPWHPYVVCEVKVEYDNTGFNPSYIPKDLSTCGESPNIYIFNESEIQDCWAQAYN